MDNQTSFHENPDNLFDTEMRRKAVEGGVASHSAKIDDENRLAVPNFDESTASDYIRNRIEPPADMVDGRDVFKAEAVEQPESDYEKDIKKLRTLTRGELRKLLDEVESKSKEGRGLFSKGGLLNGYAIDRETLESLQSVHHDTVGFELAAKISEQLRDSGNLESWNIDKIQHRRIVEGLVYLEVPGFKSPIAKLYFGMKEMGDEVPKKDVEKIASHLKHERKFLPISSNFRVL